MNSKDVGILNSSEVCVGFDTTCVFSLLFWISVLYILLTSCLFDNLSLFASLCCSVNCILLLVPLHCVPVN